MEACPQCGAQLTAGAKCFACMLDLGLDDEDRSVMTARSFGDFEIDEEIARGGMGVIYRARQISLNREVALKCIHPERLTSESLVRRFQLEAEAAANLDHPNIVPVYDTGAHDGRPYLCMKLIEGSDLAMAIRATTIPASQTRTVVEQMSKVARAVHYAHERGILHRDLKPSNILLDQDGEPYVTDFGLAKFLDTEADLTRTAAILGTPHYMSPEQCQGNQRLVSVTSDVFSLSIILYHLLTGKAPFTGDTSLDVMRQIADPAPVKPLTIGDTPVDRDLDTICRKGLEKEPQARYPSALAFAEDLQRWLDGEPIAARPVGMTERTLKWARRNPALATLASIAFIAVVLGSAISVRYGMQAKAEAVRANNAAATLAENLYAADMKVAQEAIDDGRFAYARRLLVSHPRKLRGWIWHWLWERVQSQKIHTLTGHTKPVNGVAVSHDGHLLASAGSDASVRLWDPLSGSEITCFTAEHEGLEFTDVAFSTGDDQHLMAISARIVSINPIVSEYRNYHFRFESGQLQLTRTEVVLERPERRLGVLIDEQGIIRSGGYEAKFPPDAKRPGRGVFVSADLVITAGRDYAIRVWEKRDELLHEREVLRGHEDTVSGIAVAPSGDWLATSSEDQTIAIWSLSGQTEGPVIIPSMRAYPLPIVYSPNGQLIVGCAADIADPYRLTVWELDRRTIVNEVWGLPLKFAEEGRQLITLDYVTDTSKGGYAAGNAGGRIKGYQGNGLVWWDISKNPAEKKRELALMPATTNQMMTAQLSPDGKELLIGGMGGEVFRYDTVTGQLLGILLKLKSHVMGLTYSPDGEYLGFGGGECGYMRLATGERFAGPDARKAKLTKPEFSPDSRWFAYSPFDGSIQVKDLKNPGPWKRITGNKAAVKYLSFSADSRTLAGGDVSGVVRLWDMATFRELANFPLNRYCIFGPDGRTLLGGTREVSVMRLSR